MKSPEHLPTSVKGFILRWFARGGAIGLIAIASILALRAVFSKDPNLVLLASGFLSFGTYCYGQAVRSKRINDATVQGFAELIAHDPTTPNESADPAIQAEIDKQVGRK